MPRHSRPKDGVASLAYARKILKQQTGVIHRPCYLVGVGTAVISLPLTHVRERSAERRYFIVWHLVEGAHVPCGHAASRRSTGGVFHPGTVLPGPDTGAHTPR